MSIKTTRNYKKYIKWFWLSFLGGILFIILLLFLASKGFLGYMPDFKVLENPKSNLSTQILSEDGKVIGKFYIKENRTPIRFDELSPYLSKALIATEDERYYSHSGIDFRSLTRAIAFLGTKGGGSTITQQLSKLLFHKREHAGFIKKVIQKIKEQIIAVRLERQYTKNEIIAMYLNQFDWLNQGVGIKSASRIYFNKEPKDLKIEEAAVLVGMLKNPAYFRPISRPERTKKRRNVVLHQMAKNGYITEKQKDSLQKLALKLDFHPERHDEGMATYLREYIRKFVSNWAKKHPKPDGSSYNIYTDGIKIYTTIDSRLQANAEAAVKEHMKRLQTVFDKQAKHLKNAPFYFPKLGPKATQKEIAKIMKQAMRRSERWRVMKKAGLSNKEIEKSFHKKIKMRVFSWNGDIDTLLTPYDSIRYYKRFLHAGLMSMEPTTGHIKAWVGGINFKHFKYDHVKQGARQVGSTFKPFVYATAINQKHLSPCDSFPNVPYTIESGRWGLSKPWTPKNAGGGYGGKLTLKQALANSVNVITAQLIDMVGPKPVVDLAKNLGVKHDIPEVPSIALGTPEISLYEMIGALNGFSNKGVYIEPYVISRITDKNGVILYEKVPKSKEVLSPEIAYTVINLMQGVTQSGTGSRLRGSWAKKTKFYKEVMTGYPYNFTNEIAGKTGTTQNQSDGWFMGLVPNLSTGVWVGAEDRAVHFKSVKYGQGATMALPIWGTYMKMNYADKKLNISKKPFDKPDNISINLDCNKKQDNQNEDTSPKNNQNDDLDDDLDG